MYLGLTSVQSNAIEYNNKFYMLFYFGWVKCFINTVKVIWRHSNFTGGGKFQAQADTLIEHFVS